MNEELKDGLLAEATEFDGLAAGEFLETEAAPEERRIERQYCVFRAGRERFCFSVLEVEEVVEVPMLAQGFAPSFKAIAGDGSGEAMVAAAAAK